MSTMKSGAFFKTPIGKILLGCIFLMVVSWTVFFWQFSGELGNIFPTESEIATMKAEVKKTKADFEFQEAKMKELDTLRKLYKEQSTSYWNNDKDGEVETYMREMISNLAADLEVRLSSLGSVRETKINNELSYAEIDLMCSDSLRNIITLMSEIQKLNPKLYWRRIDIRPEPQRQQPSSLSSSTQRTTSGNTTNIAAPNTTVQDNLRFSAALRVIRTELKNDTDL